MLVTGSPRMTGGRLTRSRTAHCPHHRVDPAAGVEGAARGEVPDLGEPHGLGGRLATICGF